MKERSVCRNICLSYKEIQVNGVSTGITVLFGEIHHIRGHREVQGSWGNLPGTKYDPSTVQSLFFSMILKYHEVE